MKAIPQTKYPMTLLKVSIGLLYEDKLLLDKQLDNILLLKEMINALDREAHDIEI